MAVPITVREAAVADLPHLAGTELAAGCAFRSVGMAPVADDEPPALEELVGYQQAGRCWVADDSGAVVAYAIIDVVDCAAHVEQVSVHPDWARQRIGQRLLEMVAGWAAAEGLASLTLTTFSDVAWNRPYYERLGFRVVDEARQSAGLRRIRGEEAARGLDRWPRVAMRREVGASWPDRARAGTGRRTAGGRVGMPRRAARRPSTG